MKAILPAANTENGRNHSGQKEEIQTYKLLAIKKGDIREIVTCRLWMSRSSNAHTVYGSIWVDDRANHRYYAGHGTAGGYGYHKQSAAVGSAISNAGIELYGDCYTGPGEKPRGDQKENFKHRAHINGCGDKAAEDAILSIGIALGYTRKQLYLVR